MGAGGRDREQVGEERGGGRGRREEEGVGRRGGEEG